MFEDTHKKKIPIDAGEEGEEEVQEEGDPGPDAMLAALTQELEAERDGRLRALAELQNFRRRSEEQRAQQLQYANERLLTDLIPVLDHFELASTAGGASEETRIVCKGYDMILQQLKDLVASYGLNEIETVEGMMFDPELHDAVERIPTGEACEGTVMKVLRKGYRLHDRIVRHAQVAVAVGKG